jgi:adenylosuccinate synthase
MPGWSAPTRGLRAFADLPEAARRYVSRLEEVSGVPAAIISTGSERDHTILRQDLIAKARLPIADLLEK